MTKLSVSELTIYPIKSARGLNFESIQLNPQGPECDRRWMVIDSNNAFVTQRKFTKMCLIDTQLNGDELFISAQGFGQCRLPQGGSKSFNSSVWGTVVNGEDCGDEAAEWVSAFLGKECRIIYMRNDYSRLVDTNFATQNERVGFADGFPLLITTQASLDDFNLKLSSAHPELKVDMRRFRPNIVITGNAAWAEDQWQQISIAGIEFSLVKPCSRCIMPSVNPETGEKQMAVNKALLEHRQRDKQTYFGQNALSQSLGRISVGDTVEILN